METLSVLLGGESIDLQRIIIKRPVMRSFDVLLQNKLLYKTIKLPKIWEVKTARYDTNLEVTKSEVKRCSRWSLGIDKWFHPTLNWAWNHFSMLVLMVNHVRKRCPRVTQTRMIRVEHGLFIRRLLLSPNTSVTYDRFDLILKGLLQYLSMPYPDDIRPHLYAIADAYNMQ